MFEYFKLKQEIRELNKLLASVSMTKVQEIKPGTVCVVYIPAPIAIDVDRVQALFHNQILKAYGKDVPMGIMFVCGSQRIEIMNKGETDGIIDKSN